MFVQVIQGKTSDPEGFTRQVKRWDTELQPGAQGFLGSTGGVAADGSTVFATVRFKDEAAAKANSERPEQGAWFNELQKYFDGEPTFRNSSDVVTLLNPSDKAGFVQVMIIPVKDRKAMEALDATFMDELPKVRPDLLGALRVWDGDTAIDVNYFTSEAEARKNEANMGEMSDAMKEFEAVMAGEPTFIDLPNPILRSA